MKCILPPTWFVRLAFFGRDYLGEWQLEMNFVQCVFTGTALRWEHDKNANHGEADEGSSLCSVWVILPR